MKTGKQLFIELVNEKKYNIEEILYILRLKDDYLKEITEWMRIHYND